MMVRMVGGWVFLLVPAHPGSCCVCCQVRPLSHSIRSMPTSTRPTQATLDLPLSPSIDTDHCVRVCGADGPRAAVGVEIPRLLHCLLTTGSEPGRRQRHKLPTCWTQLTRLTSGRGRLLRRLGPNQIQRRTALTWPAQRRDRTFLNAHCIINTCWQRKYGYYENY